MSAKPRLSILTPVFNAKTFIEACINNVITEQAEGIEHIICDGASTDGTTQIIEAYAARYPHIRLFSEKDTGQSNAMNKALGHAQAEVVGFLNADDFYETGTLRTVLQKFSDSKHLTFWMGNCQMWGEGNIKLSLNKPSAHSLCQLIAGFEAPYNPSAYFYHKAVHDIIGGYDENDHYTMDLDFLLRAFKIMNIKHANATWGNFRFIAGAKTFEDAKKGSMFKRCDDLKNHAFEQLGVAHQLLVKGYQAQLRLTKAACRRLKLQKAST